MRGCFIAFEGANGVGKSTIINNIYHKLLIENVEVFLIKRAFRIRDGFIVSQGC